MNCLKQWEKIYLRDVRSHLLLIDPEFPTQFYMVMETEELIYYNLVSNAATITNHS